MLLICHLLWSTQSLQRSTDQRAGSNPSGSRLSSETRWHLVAEAFPSISDPLQNVRFWSEKNEGLREKNKLPLTECARRPALMKLPPQISQYWHLRYPCSTSRSAASLSVTAVTCSQPRSKIMKGEIPEITGSYILNCASF